MSGGQEIFKGLLKAKGLKVTPQRLLILKVLAEHPGFHMAVEDIYDLVRAQVPEVGLATVYRTVQLLLEMQLVDRIYLDDGCIRYEISQLLDSKTKHKHHHLICSNCGKVLAFNDDLLDEVEIQIEKATGFRIMNHELNFYGQCRDCTTSTGIK